MTKIDRVLKKLSELYEFNRQLKAYKLKKEAGMLTEDAVTERRAPQPPLAANIGSSRMQGK